MSTPQATITMPAAVKPLRRTNVTVEELDGEALIYDAVTSDTHRLNRTAYFVWRACDGRSSIAELGRALTDSFDVALTEARAHAQRIVHEFIERGLVFVDPLSEA